jgi:hypothetical protein
MQSPPAFNNGYTGHASVALHATFGRSFTSVNSAAAVGTSAAGAISVIISAQYTHKHRIGAADALSYGYRGNRAVHGARTAFHTMVYVSYVRLAFNQ